MFPSNNSDNPSNLTGSTGTDVGLPSPPSPTSGLTGGGAVPSNHMLGGGVQSGGAGVGFSSVAQAAAAVPHQPTSIPQSTFTSNTAVAPAPTSFHRQQFGAGAGTSAATAAPAPTSMYGWY